MPMEATRHGARGRALLAWALFVAHRFTGSDAQRLPGHSIASPPNIYSLASDWYTGGTVIPTQESLTLNPGTPNRVGMLWASYPLLTNNFEVSMTLRGRRPPERQAKEGGFAFWYVYENGTEAHNKLVVSHAENQDSIIAGTWNGEFTKAGMQLLGYRNKFDGLGVFFLDDKEPSVSAIPNDGSKSFRVGAGLPTTDAVKFDFYSGEDFTVKVKISPESGVVDIPGRGKIDIKGTFRPGGYIGLTSWGGAKLTPESKEQAGSVEVRTLDTMNLDSSSVGEQAHETAMPPVVPPDEKKDVLAESSSYKDHRAESDAIKDLTNMVFKLVVETQPQRQQMQNAIQSLAKRVETMESNFALLKTELDRKTGHKLGEEFAEVKKELASLTGTATKESQERHAKLESLHADITDVHKKATQPDRVEMHLDKLAESNSKVINQLQGEHQRMFGVSIAAIAFIVISGLALYNKFRCWEKKHVL